MDKQKHTPGPWKQVGISGLSIVATHEQGNASALVASCNYEIRPYMEQYANARIIAAAPDLLEALIAIRDVDIDGFRQWAGGYADAIKKAEAAIAKATGQEAGAQ